MINHTVCKGTSSNHISGKPICKQARPNVKLEDPPQVCQFFFSVLMSSIDGISNLEEFQELVSYQAIRDTSVVFAATNYVSPVLLGVAVTVWKEITTAKYMQKFINHVNTVAQKCHGKLVEEFSVKFEFDTTLLDHLDNWVNFAVSSQAKSIALYLRPINKRLTDVDRYVFPFHLLDSESNMSHLQSIQLSFVSFRPPSEFRGFPSVRKLDLEFVHISIEDIEVLLSNCCNLGWLSLVRSYLNGELKLNHLLSHLRHLTVVYCKVTRIELQVTNLVTFVYCGPIVPIVINQHSKLKNAYIHFSMATFHDAASALLNGIPSIQNLTFQTTPSPLEEELLLNNKCKFSHLRCLQLLISILAEDTYMLPHVLVSVLMAAPCFEKLEIHFAAGSHLCFANNCTLCKKHLQPCEYSYLKCMHMTGYKGARGQLEFLLHIVENAPMLEVLTVETTQRLY